MANINKIITLSSWGGSSGPLYNAYYSTDNITFTIAISGSNLYLPNIGSSATIIVPDTTNYIKLINDNELCGEASAIIYTGLSTTTTSTSTTSTSTTSTSTSTSTTTSTSTSTSTSTTTEPPTTTSTSTSTTSTSTSTSTTTTAGPPSFYTSSFGSNTITPFYAINDGGWDSVNAKWQQWGSISGSLPTNIGAYSSVASGSGTITYNSTYETYTFDNKHIFWTGSVGRGAWLNQATPSGTNWNEQQFAIFWQGVLLPGSELQTSYIASAGDSSLTSFYGWDLTWNTGSVIWTGGTTTNNVNKKKFFSGSFETGQKYNVMYVMNYGSSAGIRYGNMFYAKVNADGTSQPVTQSSNGPYNFSGDGYNYAVYTYDAGGGNTAARVGKGTLSSGTAGLVTSGSLHSFMMFSFPPYSSVPAGSFLWANGTQNSGSNGADSYVKQIFVSASSTWIT